MLVTTTIDLPKDVYQYFISASKNIPHMTPEKLMAHSLRGCMNSQLAYEAKLEAKRASAAAKKANNG